MHPMFVTLFLTADADELLAEEQDRRRRPRRRRWPGLLGHHPQGSRACRCPEPGTRRAPQHPVSAAARDRVAARGQCHQRTSPGVLAVRGGPAARQGPGCPSGRVAGGSAMSSRSWACRAATAARLPPDSDAGSSSSPRASTRTASVSAATRPSSLCTRSSSAAGDCWFCQPMYLPIGAPPSRVRRFRPQRPAAFSFVFTTAQPRPARQGQKAFGVSGDRQLRMCLLACRAVVSPVRVTVPWVPVAQA